MDEPTAEDSLCDALLAEFGVPGGTGSDREGKLSTARDMIRPQARMIMQELFDDGFVIERMRR